MGQCWAKQGNIGHDGQNRRLRMSIFVLSIALALAVFLIKADYPVWTRGFLFLPLFAAAAGGLQALHQTCWFAAFKGIRMMDDGERPIADPNERSRMKRSAIQVLAESAIAASAATAIVLLVP